MNKGRELTELNTSIVARPIGTGLRLDLAAAAVGRRAGAIVPLLVLVVGWEAASRSGVVTPFLLPPISAVLERVWQDALSGELAVNLGLTLFRSLVGFAIAAGRRQTHSLSRPRLGGGAVPSLPP